MRSAVSVAMCSVLLAACATTHWPTPVDPSAVSVVPDQFLGLDEATGARFESTGPGCRSPLVDPRDGTRLRLVESGAGVGDYLPERPRYGLTGDQRLRVDCRNGRALGASGSR